MILKMLSFKISLWYISVDFYYFPKSENTEYGETIYENSI